MTTTSRPDRLDPALVKTALVLVLGALAPLLDSTIVSVAVPTLGTELHAPVSTIQWVSTGYLLALAMTVPITAWAVDAVGAKRMWLLSLALFLAGSVLCGVAWDVGSLIAFRVLQGVGGGLMLPILQTILMRAAAGRAIGRLMAVITLPALVGPILGPVLGGLIVGNLSWRWIFYVNVPVCVVAAVLAWRRLPADAPTRRRRFDLAGMLLLSPGVAALVYGLAQVGSSGGFGHPEVLVPLIGGAVLLAGFVVRAQHTAAPLIDLSLFRIRSFAASSALLFVSGLALFGAMLLLPLYYQEVRGASVITAALLLVPQGVGSVLARAAGGLIDRFGSRPVVLVGIALTLLGTVPFAVDAAHVNDVLLAAALVVRGAGLSAASMAVMVGAYRGLDPAQVPHASSTTRIMQQLGGSFGAAVLAVIVENGLAGGAAAAFGTAFTWALGLTALAVVPALMLPSTITT